MNDSLAEVILWGLAFVEQKNSKGNATNVQQEKG